MNSILANCPYLLGTVPIFTQERVGISSDFTMCPYFLQKSVYSTCIMYWKFRNVRAIFKDFPPIFPYFLGFRVGKYANCMFSHIFSCTMIGMMIWITGSILTFVQHCILIWVFCTLAI